MNNHAINRLLRKGAALAGLASLLAMTSPSRADDFRVQPEIKPEIIPPSEDYSSLLANWWQWTLSFPTNADPAADTAPQDSKQEGPVWFLAGLHGSAAAGGSGTVTRTLTIPEGTALFFPVLSIETDNTGCPDFTDFTVKELRAENTNNWTLVSETSCTIDGVPVRELSDPQTTPYLVQSTAFSYTLARSDNIVANDFGEPCVRDGLTVYPAVAEGVCLFVAPLSPGHHSIHFVGIVGPVSAPFVDFDETYDITVSEPRPVKEPGPFKGPHPIKERK